MDNQQIFRKYFRQPMLNSGAVISTGTGFLLAVASWVPNRIRSGVSGKTKTSPLAGEMEK
jgi:hypothetical protein